MICRVSPVRATKVEHPQPCRSCAGRRIMTPIRDNGKGTPDEETTHARGFRRRSAGRWRQGHVGQNLRYPAGVDETRLCRHCQVQGDVRALGQGSERLLGGRGQAPALVPRAEQDQERVVRAGRCLDQVVRGRQPQRRLQLHRSAPGDARTADRHHLEGDDPSQSRHITYQQLHDEVCKLANILRNRNVEKGDRVTIYMPMIPEAVYAMLACARIGAIHSVVFGGFSPESLAGRIEDCGSKVVITADEGVRGGRKVPLKANTDAAIAKVGGVDHVIVVRRTGAAVDMDPVRDVYYDKAAEVVTAECPCEHMNAEDPLFILYTSGSTGKPKGVLHTTGGYHVFTAMTH